MSLFGGIFRHCLPFSHVPKLVAISTFDSHWLTVSSSLPPCRSFTVKIDHSSPPSLPPHFFNQKSALITCHCVPYFNAEHLSLFIPFCLHSKIASRFSDLTSRAPIQPPSFQLSVYCPRFQVRCENVVSVAGPFPREDCDKQVAFFACGELMSASASCIVCVPFCLTVSKRSFAPTSHYDWQTIMSR